MPWSSYKDWNGVVVGARIRVPAHNARGASCFGPAMFAQHLRAGAVGTIVNILPEGARLPGYVKFRGSLVLQFAAEVEFRRRDNTAFMWDEFKAGPVQHDDVLVVITRPVLDTLEIEHA